MFGDYFNHDPRNMFGMKVYEAPVKLIPKIQISKDFKWCSDEFREKMDAELARKFGSHEECAIPKGMAFMFHNNIVMRPESAMIIRNIVA